MDQLSLTCNVAGVLTVAGQLISVGYSYGSSVAGFPEKIQEFIAELTSLSGILSALKAVIDQPPIYHSDGSTYMQSSLIATFLSDPLEECEKILQSVLESLVNQNMGSKMQKVLKRATWPLKEGDTKDLFAKLERYKKTCSLALSADEATLMRLISNDIESIRRDQATEIKKKELTIKNEKFRKIIRWLSPADPEINHVAARQLQEAGTGNWFAGGNVFRNWLLLDRSFLWLHGKPGAGKTILSSIIIDRVMSEVYTSSNAASAVIYFYFDFRDSLKQTVAGLLGSLLAQLIQKKPEIPHDLERLYSRLDEGKKPLEIYHLNEYLHLIIKEFSKVIVIVDALDECVEQDLALEMLERLRGSVNLLVTSRDELNIKLQFENLPSLLINEKDISGDIECFVTNELMRQPKLKRLKHTTKSDIIYTLVNGANGMFRWAKCCLDEITKLRNDKAIKAALKSLPPTLEKSYERILCNIPNEDKNLAIRIFQWLLSSRRPIDMWEMVDAIAVEIGDTFMDPDSKLNEPDDIIHICGGLVDLNKWNMTLGLAHFTVEEYLTSTDISQGPAAAYQVHLQIANAELTKTCLTYILFDDFNTGPCKTEAEFLARLNEYPLLRYAPFHWPQHVRKYEIGSDKTLDNLVLSFFRLKQDSGRFLSWLQIYKTGDYRSTASFSDYEREPETQLYLAAQMGQHPAVKELLIAGADINAKGGALGSPLVAAASEGHLDTLRILLEKGAGLGCQGSKQYRPLYQPMRKAAINGFAECVQVLLDYGTEETSDWVSCCDDAMDDLGLQGHENVMGVFLATEYFNQVPTVEEANSNTHMHPFLKAFYMCVHYGWEQYIRSLWGMGHEVVISAKESKLFISCLRTATMYGHVRFLKIIIQGDELKSFCIKHDMYQVLLQEAAYYDQDKIVEFLLGFNEISGSMGLALHIAAAKGNIGIMERLLRAGADPQHKDDDGWSPLAYASQYQTMSGIEKLSSLMDILEGLDTGTSPKSWDIGARPQNVEVSAEGLEINAGTGFTTRALHPINPLCTTYSFEVEIIARSSISIGFGDALYSFTGLGQGIFGTQPGYSDMSWGYSHWGEIMFDDRMGAQRVQGYGVGDIVGCHFDKSRSLAFFTVNGTIAGKPIANIKGKIVPIISLAKGAHIRTNFGDSPFIYPMPDLSRESLSNTWTPSDFDFQLRPPKPLV